MLLGSYGRWPGPEEANEEGKGGEVRIVCRECSLSWKEKNKVNVKERLIGGESMNPTVAERWSEGRQSA